MTHEHDQHRATRGTSPFIRLGIGARLLAAAGLIALVWLAIFVVVR